MHSAYVCFVSTLRSLPGSWANSRSAAKESHLSLLQDTSLPSLTGETDAERIVCSYSWLRFQPLRQASFSLPCPLWLTPFPPNYGQLEPVNFFSILGSFHFLHSSITHAVACRNAWYSCSKRQLAGRLSKSAFHALGILHGATVSGRIPKFLLTLFLPIGWKL